MKTLLIISSKLEWVYSLRKELIEEFVKDFNVYICTFEYQETYKSYYFESLGVKLISIKSDGRSINPVNNIYLFYSYYKIINKLKPDYVITYTIKPNIYAGFMCRIKHIPYIPNITGLGKALNSSKLLSIMALLLYKVSFKNALAVLFQNKSNMELFESKNIVINNAILLPGSGVNLEKHCFEEYPINNGIIKILFIGRIMREKGIEELLEAIKVIMPSYSYVEFHIVGECIEKYKKILNDFKKNELICYHGRQEEVHSFIKECHATVLPSYHEGMSNVLLESASTGRCILASNIPGCNETFDEGISGYGFEPRNINNLVDTLIKFIELPYDKKEAMGMAGRIKMENQFNRDIVIQQYLKIINKD